MLFPRNINSHILAAFGTLIICAVIWGSFQLNLTQAPSPVVSDAELDDLLQHFDNFELESPISHEMTVNEVDNNTITEAVKQNSAASNSPSSNEILSASDVNSVIKPDELLPKDTVIEKIEIVKVLEVDSMKLIPKNADIVADIREKTKTKTANHTTDEQYQRDLENYRFYQKNYRNIRNFKIVYPYAIKTREIISALNEELSMTKNELKRKALIREMENKLFKEYESAVRNMSTSQGKLLLKLIARETDKTGYEIIKEYRGGFSAAFWYGVGRIFGTDLKTEFNKQTEDSIIETIVEKYKRAEL